MGNPKLSEFDAAFLQFPILRITHEIKPKFFDEKRGIIALLIKKSGFYSIFNPKSSRTKTR